MIVDTQVSKEMAQMTVATGRKKHRNVIKILSVRAVIKILPEASVRALHMSLR